MYMQIYEGVKLIIQTYPVYIYIYMSVCVHIGKGKITQIKLKFILIYTLSEAINNG